MSRSIIAAATALVAEDLAPPSLALLPPAQLALVGDALHASVPVLPNGE